MVSAELVRLIRHARADLASLLEKSFYLASRGGLREPLDAADDLAIETVKVLLRAARISDTEGCQICLRDDTSNVNQYPNSN